MTMKQRPDGLEVVVRGVELLAELVPFFPSSLAARGVIAAEILNFVGTEEQLDWFIQAAIRQFPKFEGVPALRALYCSRYQADDGVYIGTPEQMEAHFWAREMDENEARMERYRQEALVAGEPLKAFPLPEVKRIQ